MKQGTAAAALADRKDDLYETPPEAVHALLANFPVTEPVWEPCAGRGAISRILLSEGHTVHAQDLCTYNNQDPYIQTRIDFLMELAAPCRLIITNPPYKLADQFIRHGLAMGCTFVALLRLAAIEGAGRSDIMNFCRHIYAGIERLPMMHREGWQGTKVESNSTPFAWFVFDPAFTGVTTLSRITWRLPKDFKSESGSGMNG